MDTHLKSARRSYFIEVLSCLLFFYLERDFVCAALGRLKVHKWIQFDDDCVAGNRTHSRCGCEQSVHKASEATQGSGFYFPLKKTSDEGVCVNKARSYHMLAVYRRLGIKVHDAISRNIVGKRKKNGI